jgi:hypothetical protein
MCSIHPFPDVLVPFPIHPFLVPFVALVHELRIIDHALPVVG